MPEPETSSPSPDSSPSSQTPVFRSLSKAGVFRAGPAARRAAEAENSAILDAAEAQPNLAAEDGEAADSAELEAQNSAPALESNAPAATSGREDLAQDSAPATGPQAPAEDSQAPTPPPPPPAELYPILPPPPSPREVQDHQAVHAPRPVPAPPTIPDATSEAAPTKTPTGQEIAARVERTSTARSSLVMAAGTLASRLLGFVRSWMLVAAIGGFGVADAFNAANTMPNTLYNLLAGGVLNAILVPSIVRALSRNSATSDAGTRQVNALLTVAALILLGLTVASVALVYPLTLLFAGDISARLLPLTVVFALWCLPQIFFYGVYALLGQVLNSLSNFGPYMWAPVVNNLIAIAGLGVFVGSYGLAPAGAELNLAAWDGPRITLLAGSATAGVVVQALVLLIPLRLAGYHLRPVFQVRGMGLRRIGQVAIWAFASLVASTIGYLLIVRVAAAANGWGVEHGTFVVSTSIFSYAYLLYMLPQSLVTTSITTALFTGMAHRATSGDMQGLARDYGKALRLTALFTICLAAMMFVGALPLARLTASNLPAEQAGAMAALLMLMAFMVPFQTLSATNARLFYAVENTRALFWVTLPLPLATAVGALGGMYLLPAKFWVAAAVAGDLSGTILSSLTGYFYLRRQGLTRAAGAPSTAGAFARYALAAVVAGVPAFSLMTHLGATPAAAHHLTHATSIGGQLFQGAWQSLLVGAIMGPLYLAVLWFTRCPDLPARLRRSPKPAPSPSPSALPSPSSQTSAPAGASPLSQPVPHTLPSPKPAPAPYYGKGESNAPKSGGNVNTQQWLQRQKREGRLVVLIIGAALAGAAFLSVGVLSLPFKAEIGRPANADLDLTAPHTEASAIPAPSPTPITLAGVNPVNLLGDRYGHAELVGNVIDGNPTTQWQTSRFPASKLANGAYGVEITFANPVTPREVRVQSSARGGILQLRATSAADPLGGTLLGEQPVSDNITFKIDNPPQLSSIVLVSRELPQAAGGEFRLVINEVEVLG